MIKSSASGDEGEDVGRQESSWLTSSTSGSTQALACREATSDPTIECNESEDNGAETVANGNPADHQQEQEKERTDDNGAASASVAGSSSEEPVTVMMMAAQKEGMLESPVQNSDSSSSRTKAAGDGRHAGGLSAGTSLTLSILILVLAAVLLIICFLLRIRDQSRAAGGGNETKVISLQRSQHDSSIYFDKSPVVPDAGADEEAADGIAVYDKRPLASQT